jgi:hypothetical protein
MQLTRVRSNRILSDPGIGEGTALAQWRSAEREPFLTSRPFLLALAAGGALLRLWQFLGGASLWLDELALARNVLARPLGRLLLQPLDSWQTAPPGFLLAERALAVLHAHVGVPGQVDPVLRLFPLFCSLAALLLFVRLAERTLGGLARPFAVFCFALAPEQIFYGSEVKPYATDVAVALLLWLLALHLAAEPGDFRRALGVGVTGGLAVWFSTSALLMLAGLGGALLVLAGVRARESGRRGPLLPLACALALWGAGGAAAALAALRGMGPATHAFMQRYWASAFLPPLSRPAEVLGWLGDAAHAELGHEALSYQAPFLYLVLMIVGFAVLWRQRREVALLLAGPGAVTFLAAVVHQYPFRGRLIAFLIPAVLVSLAAGLEAIRRALPPRYRAARVLLLLAFCYPPVQTLVSNPPVYRIEESRPMLAHVQARRQPGDTVYVYYAAEQAARYYGPLYGLTRGDYLLGGCHFPDRRSYLRELDLLRGRKRVWVLFSHALPHLGEREAIIAYLDRIGVRLDAVEIPTHKRTVEDNVFVYLYDLSDPRRLAAATADTVPLPWQPGPPSENAGCEGPQRPGPAPSPGEQLALRGAARSLTLQGQFQ